MIDLKMILAIITAALLLTSCSAKLPAESEIQSEPQSIESSAAENQQSESSAEYHKITAEEAYEMMQSGEVTVVDVRTQSEYDEGHIENAVLVPNETIGEIEPEKLPDKEAVLLVYCRSGRRSKEASEKLLALGYQNVYDFGGINDWNYGTVKE
jgi:phage shock protein E